MTIADFLTGLIVGTLLGLALAPILRAWIVWRISHEPPRLKDGSTRSLDPFPIE